MSSGYSFLLVDKLIEDYPSKILDGTFSISIFDREENIEAGVLSKETLDKFFSEDKFSNNEDYQRVITNIVNENYDAEDTDILFQFIFFGEIVYG